MHPQSSFKNNETAGHSIREYAALQASGRKLWLKPYNRFMPETTEWWFIPGTDWPAYHYGKLFLWRTPTYCSTPGLLYAGYYVEHGLGAELSSLPGVNKKLVMTQQWYWKQFLNQARNGAVEEVAKIVSVDSECPVRILLKAYEFNRVHQPDTEPGTPFDVLEFSLEPGKDALSTVLPGRKILRSLNESHSIAEMANLLETTKDFTFFWIDAMIGIQLNYESKEQNGRWAAKEMWHNALEPWLPFVY